MVNAVAYAIDVQRAVAERNASLPEERRVAYRIGINIGDVLVEGDDIYGDGVNVAARLEALAEPGGISISQSVYDQTHGKLDAQFEDLGDKAVKNFDDPLRVYRIVLGGEARRPGRAARPTPPRLEQARGSIAVFPFDSLSPDPDDAFIADGLASEITNMLSRISDLRVASRSAIFASRGQGGDAWKLVQEMGYRYVLTGNVRRAGDRLRVIAELTETASRSQLWSNTYQRRLADLFAVEEEIAEAIVVAFGGEYLRAEWQRGEQQAYRQPRRLGAGAKGPGAQPAGQPRRHRLRPWKWPARRSQSIRPMRAPMPASPRF